MESALSLIAFVVPSALAFWRARASKPRPGSFAAKGARLALHRLIIVGLVVALHVALLVDFASAPDTGQPAPGHQYSTEFEAWRGNAMMLAIFCALVTVAAGFAIAIVCIRELIVLAKTWRARARVLREGEAASAPDPSTPLSIDFGIGEEAWVFRGRGREGYREAPPILGWARGTPVAWRAIVGPLVSVITVLATLGLLAMDLMLSMGD